jgi:hypothetical protein
MVFYNISIDALSRAAVHNCVAFITELRKRNVATGNFDLMGLPSAIALTPEPITIYSSVPRFVDFLMCGELDNVLNLPVSGPLSLVGAFQDQTA